MSRKVTGVRKVQTRYAPSGQLPPGANLDNDPNRVSPDPQGSRAQRRLAAKQGITTTVPRSTQ